MEQVIVGPFKAIDIPTLIVIDALDKCKDEEPASAILSVLFRYVDKILNRASNSFWLSAQVTPTYHRSVQTA